MKFKPRSYQTSALDFLSDRPRAALFMDVGLGKSVTAATYMCTTLAFGKNEKWLVVAPLRVCQTTWAQEFNKWDHICRTKVTHLFGMDPDARTRLVRKPGDITVINVELVPWLVELRKHTWPFDGVVIDESSLFKSPGTQRFKQLRKIVDKVKSVVLMTGSPAAQGLLGLWSQIYLLDKGERLGRTFEAYKQTYFTSDYLGYKWTPRPGAQEQIEEAIRDLCFTVRAKDNLDLREPILNEMEVVLPPNAMREYLKLEKDMLLRLTEDKTVIAGNAGVLTGKLRQVASGAVHVDETNWTALHQVKLDALDDLVTEASGTPLLVAYHYKFERQLIAQRLGGHVEFFDGTAAQMRQWRAGEIPVLAMQPQSGGRGVDGLQGVTTQVVWTAPPWSRDLFDQFNGRVLGARQVGTHTETETGVIHIIVAADTVDTVALDVLKDRGAGQDAFLSRLQAYSRSLYTGARSNVADQEV
jgi:hypothetical protein